MKKHEMSGPRRFAALDEHGRVAEVHVVLYGLTATHARGLRMVPAPDHVGVGWWCDEHGNFEERA